MPDQIPNIDRAAYRARLQNAIIEAVMMASIVRDAAGEPVLDSNGQKICAMVSDIIVDELLMQMAFTLAGSPQCSSPTKTREECDAIGKKLRRLINETKQIGTGIRDVTVQADDL